MVFGPRRAEIWGLLICAATVLILSPSSNDSLLVVCSSRQVWTFGDMSLSSGTSGRYSVQTVTSGNGVLSSLVLSETLAQDFQLRYNCTAWNRFGTGTALVTLREQGT